MDESTARYDQAGEEDFNIEEEVEASTHMSLGKITLLREILVTQMNHLALFPLAAVIFHVSGYTSNTVFCWLMAGLVPLAFYLLRIRINNFFILLVSHLAVILAVRFIFSASGGTFVFAAASFAYAFYSFIVRMRSMDFQDGRLPMAVAAGIAVIALLFLKYAWNTDYYDMKIAVTFIISFGLSLLVTYLENYTNFLIVNRSTTGHIPAREIFFSGSFMAVACVLFMMLLLLLTSGIGWLQVILKNTGSVVSAILRVIFSMIGPDESGIYVDDTHTDNGVMPEIQEPGEPAFIWKLLTVIAAIAISVLAVYLSFCMIKRIYLFIRGRMEYKGLDSADKALGSVKDVREKCRISEKDDINETSFFKNLLKRLSPGEKIRKLYKKYVLKYSHMVSDTVGAEADKHDLHRPELMTAGEWGRVSGNPDMAKLYDKARYSGGECTPEDYKLMKQAVDKY